MPKWLINISQETKLGAIYELFKVAGHIFYFIKNSVMLSFFGGMLSYEISRIKRIIAKVVDKSRRLRVSDEDEREKEEEKIDAEVQLQVRP